MPPIRYHGVKVRWRDGRTEVFRYDTRERAERAVESLFANSETRNVYYIGARIDWWSLVTLRWFS